MKQHDRKCCVFSRSHQTRLLKQLKANTSEQYETKEIQLEATEVLRADHADF